MGGVYVWNTKDELGDELLDNFPILHERHKDGVDYAMNRSQCCPTAWLHD